MQHYRFSLFFDKKSLLKHNNVSRHPASDSSKLLQFVSFDVGVNSFLCLKLYSLNFAIAHVQKRLLYLSEFVILVLH